MTAQKCQRQEREIVLPLPMRPLRSPAVEVCEEGVDESFGGELVMRLDEAPEADLSELLAIGAGGLENTVREEIDPVPRPDREGCGRSAGTDATRELPRALTGALAQASTPHIRA